MPVSDYGLEYAANCIWVNDTVIVPEGYPAVLEAVKSMGYTEAGKQLAERRHKYLEMFLEELDEEINEGMSAI